MFENKEKIGLAVDETGIRYVMLERKGKQMHVNASGEFMFPAETFFDEQQTANLETGAELARWAKSNRLAGKQVHLSLPTSQVIIRRLIIPSANRKELKQLIELEIETSLHLPFEQPIYQYIIMEIDQQQNTTSILLYATSGKWVRSYLALLEQANVKVSSIELHAFSMLRVMENIRAKPQHDEMVIVFDEHKLEVYMYEQGSPIFVRRLNEYAYDKQNGLSQRMVESINSEISRLLSFYQYSIHEGNRRIHKAVLIGDVLGLESFVASLAASQDQLTVERLAIYNEAAVALDNYAVPYGLALYDARQHPVNLLPQREKTGLAKHTGMITIGCLLLLAIMLLSLMSASLNASMKQEQIYLSQLQQENARLNNELEQLKQQAVVSIRPDEAIQLIAEHRQNIVEVLDDLHRENSAVKPTIVQLSYAKPGKIALETTFGQMEDSAEYLTYLRRLSYIETPYLNEIMHEPASSKIHAKYSLNWAQPLQAEADTDATVEGGEAANES